MKKSNPLTFTLMLTISSFFFFSCSKEKARLSYELEEGETYLMEMHNEQEIKQVVLNQTMFVNTEMDIRMKYKVLAKTDSTYKITMSYDRLAMQLEMPQGSSGFDSDNPDTTGVLASVIKSMTLLTITMTVNHQGEILEIQGLDEMTEKIVGNMPEGEIPAQSRQMISRYLSEDAVNRNFSMGMIVYPGKSLGEGDNWEQSMEMASILKGELTTTYTLEELKLNEAVIAGEAFFDVEADSADMMMIGVSMNYDMEGPVESSYLIDTRTGWLKEGTTNQKLTGNVVMPGNEQMPEGMNLKMEIVSEITLNGKEIE